MKKRYLLLLVMLFAYFFSPALFAQEKEIQVVDEGGGAIPYLCFKSLKTGSFILSGIDGVFKVKQGEFDILDTLQIESLFFENIKIQFKDLISISKLKLRNKSLTMEEVVVYPKGRLEDILRKLSSSFSEKYAKDYASKILHLRTVEADGKYREFCGYQGIFASFDFTQSAVRFFWEDKNSMYWAPLTVMRSNPYVSNRDEILKQHSVQRDPSINALSKECLKISFLNTPSHEPLAYKRSLEMYSPLNRKQLKNFDYDIVGEYRNDLDQKIIVIRFETKRTAYPDKTVLFGYGNIYYNSVLEYVERIVMENHQDQYFMFPRLKVKGLMNSATKHVVDVYYCMDEGRIYTKSVSFDVRWVDPNVENDFYYIRQNSRRNPIKYNLHEYECVTFSDFIPLTKEKKERIRPLLSKVMGYNLIYVAKFDIPKWKNVDFTGIERDRLFKDLNIKGNSLYVQAEQNALNVDYDYSYRSVTPKAMKYLLNYYIETRKYLYPLLYHEKYE